MEPAAYPPPQAYPGYPWTPAPQAQPAYVGSPPLGYASPAPGHTAPPQGYASPAPGFAAPAQSYSQGHAAPQGSPAAVAQPAYGGPLAAPARGKGVGIVALIAGLIAFVGATVTVSIAAYRIGLGAGRDLVTGTPSADFDWSVLAPVRDWVLLAEISFWAGTALGLWALVQGIVAIATGRGRGAGAAGVVLAVLAPISFAVALSVFLGAGLAAGSGIGG